MSRSDENDEDFNDNSANLFSEMGDDIVDIAEGEEVNWSDVSSFVDISSRMPSAESCNLLQDALDAINHVNEAAIANDDHCSLTSPHIELYNSGCTHHISPYHDDFMSLVDIPPKTFHAANKQHFSAVGIGELTIDIPNGVDASKLSLTEVLYSPEVGYTLISVGKLNELRYSIMFANGKCTIRAPSGDKVGEVSKAGSSLYRMVHEHDSAQAAVEMILLDQFHCRMGHIAPEIARKLIEKGFVTSIQLDNSLAKLTFCEACVYAKATCKPVAKVRQGERATEFAGEVYSDLWGPAPVVTLQGKCYYVSFIDDKT
jgi:hypothetical protein